MGEYIPFKQNRQHLFHKYQSLLVWFLNLKEGRDWVGISEWSSKWEGQITRVSPAGFSADYEFDKFWRPKKGYFEFYPRNPMEKKLLPFLKKFDLYAPFVKDAEEAKRVFLAVTGLLPKAKEKGLYLPSILFTAFGPFNPDANPETTTVDGQIQNSNADYATCRNAAAGNEVDSTGADNRYIRQTAGGIWLARSFFLFDSSSLPDAATIDDSTFSLFGSNTVYSDQDNDSIVLVSSSPASNTDLVVGDYDQIGSTNFGAIDITSWSQVAYNDFTVNASGIATISKTGVTPFACRSLNDLNSSAPTGNAHISGKYADNGTNMPKLAGNYTEGAAGGPSGYKSLLGVGQA